MKQFVRGAGVHISVVFRDKDRGVVTPTGATVTLSYIPAAVSDCERTFITYALTLNPAPDAGDPADWFYDWDSQVASAGVIYGTAETTTVGVPVSRIDFSFQLTANRSNKELAGEGIGTGY